MSEFQNTIPEVFNPMMRDSCFTYLNTLKNALEKMVIPEGQLRIADALFDEKCTLSGESITIRILRKDNKIQYVVYNETTTA